MLIYYKLHDDKFKLKIWNLKSEKKAFGTLRWAAMVAGRQDHIIVKEARGRDEKQEHKKADEYKI